MQWSVPCHPYIIWVSDKGVEGCAPVIGRGAPGKGRGARCDRGGCRPPLTPLTPYRVSYIPL